MRASSVFVVSVMLGSMGCAGSVASLGRMAASGAGESGLACPLGQRYTEDELAVIGRMRDDGAGRKEVAEQVGGTRQDVKCAEAALLARRREGARDKLMSSARLATSVSTANQTVATQILADR
jgi:hypothetical protein